MWFLSNPLGACGGNTPACPATFDSLGEGAPCPGASDLLCDYDEGRCACQLCSVDADGGETAREWASGEWVCRKWSDVPPGCPTDVPVIGQSCSKLGLACDYSSFCGGVSFGGSFQCDGKTWWGGPVSAGSCMSPGRCGP
jgi:hypothetical protein